MKTDALMNMAPIRSILIFLPVISRRSINGMAASTIKAIPATYGTIPNPNISSNGTKI